MHNMSEMEFLAVETHFVWDRNESRVEVEKRIKGFLNEDSIIARTENCSNYFNEYVTPLGISTIVMGYP